MAIIEVQNLTKSYGERTALREVDLKVERKDFLVVVGPSGAGKTTLLRLLDLLEEPTSGRIFFDGKDTACTDQGKVVFRRHIGMVFQRANMLNTSVYENVAYPLRIRGVTDKMAERINDVLELVGLGGFEKRKAVTLSGGEMQRVSLAQSLIL